MVRWFKHYNNIHKSKYYQSVYEVFGKAEGHGLITLFVSFFADKYEKDSGHFFRIRTKELANFMEISPKKLLKFCVIRSKSENLSIKVCGDFLEVDFPKLLKIQDEYTRKSGQAPDKNPDSVALDKIRTDKIRKDVNSGSPKKPKNSAKNFENSFDPELQSWIKILAEIEICNYQTKNLIGQVHQLKLFKSLSDFENWVELIFEAPTFVAMTNTQAKIKYLNGALVNMLKEAQA